MSFSEIILSTLGTFSSLGIAKFSTFLGFISTLSVATLAEPGTLDFEEGRISICS